MFKKTADLAEYGSSNEATSLYFYYITNPKMVIMMNPIGGRPFFYNSHWPNLQTRHMCFVVFKTLDLCKYHFTLDTIWTFWAFFYIVL